MDEGGARLRRRPHIVFLPTPGMGHLIPISELAKLLVDRHDFTATIIVFAESSNKAQDHLLSSLPSSITSLSLPPIPLSDLPPNSRIETRLSVAASRSVPSLSTLLSTLLSSSPILAFVADLFASPACDAASSLRIPHYIFIPSNLQFLTLMLHLPSLHSQFPRDFRHLPTPLRLPGLPPIPGPDILDPLQDRSNDCYNWMLHHAARYREADGIIVNTFDAVEKSAAEILKKKQDIPTVYTVGPLIRGGNGKESGARCLEWLDLQPKRSVVLVSFGSAGTVSRRQLGELARGLEESGSRFLWVVRRPLDWDSAGNYFTAEGLEEEMMMGYLPEGFLGRIEGVGMVVGEWVPQVEVLGHDAVGGFVTHCGWNSVLESLANGVPMICWPLFAEQRMNGVMLVEGVKVAMRLKGREEDGVFHGEDICEVVKELMEGEEGERMRRRAEEMAIEVVKAIGEGGSSSIDIALLAEKWRSFSVV